jgi:hypothetical protein
VLDAGGGVLRDAPVAWRSLDPSLLSVNPTNGLAAAADTGTARVVATSGTLTDTARVRITRRVATLSLELPDSVFAGGAVTATVVARDVDGEVIPDAPLLWSTSDSSVLAVRDARSVFAAGEGQATIVVQSGSARTERSVRARWRRLQLGFAPTALALGDGFGCALDADGRAHCWGSNAPALGRGTTPNGPGIAPVDSDQRFTRIDADQNAVCAITTTSRLFCWGRRAGGGTRYVPNPVIDSVPMRDVSVGTEGVACALGTDDILRCWGRNDAYQAGYAPLGEPPYPLPVNTAERFVSGSVGFHSACGITRDGAPLCWGEMPSYLGVGSWDTLSFIRVGGMPALASVVMHGYAAACGLTASGETWCWGTLVGATAERLEPQRLPIPPMRALSGSWGASCGTGIDGEAWCWGADLASLRAPRRWGAPHRFRHVEINRGNGRCGTTTEGEVLCDGAVAVF